MLRHLVVLSGIAFGLAIAVPHLLSTAVPPEGGRAETLASAAPDAGSGAGSGAVPGQVVLRQGRDGHFRADAVINGRSIPVMVDTGASVVALRFEDAERLGLVHAGDRFDVPVSTANGVARARRVRLNSIRISGIVIHDVEGLVTQKGVMSTNLLGMSFLNRLALFEVRGGNLRMER